MVDRIFKIAYYIFVAAILALGVLMLLSAMPHANLKVKIVQSGSMEPAISTGSIVVIHREATYQVGEVVTFFFDPGDTTPTTHRIVEKNRQNGEASYSTKGDANEEMDPRQIPESAVVGKVIFSVPFVGYILDFAKQPWGFALIIGLPAAFIIFDEVMKIYAEVRRTLREEREVKEATEIN